LTSAAQDAARGSTAQDVARGSSLVLLRATITFVVVAHSCCRLGQPMPIATVARRRRGGGKIYDSILAFFRVFLGIELQFYPYNLYLITFSIFGAEIMVFALQI